MKSLPAFRSCLVPLAALVLAVTSCATGQAPAAPEAKVIVIDPGHGGRADAGTDKDRNRSSSNNAESAARGIKEKDMTLELSRLVRDRINGSAEGKAGRVKAILTRDADVNPDFTKRAAIAAEAGAACYAAIHFNADPSKAVSGPRAVHQQEKGNPNLARDKAFALALAEAVRRATVKFRAATPQAMIHDDRELHGGTGSYLFHQLNLEARTRMIPACHLEVEFLDNRRIEEDFFVKRKDGIFNAWATEIAAELVRQVE